MKRVFVIRFPSIMFGQPNIFPGLPSRLVVGSWSSPSRANHRFWILLFCDTVDWEDMKPSAFVESNGPILRAKRKKEDDRHSDVLSKIKNGPAQFAIDANVFDADRREAFKRNKEAKLGVKEKPRLVRLAKENARIANRLSEVYHRQVDLGMERWEYQRYLTASNKNKARDEELRRIEQENQAMDKQLAKIKQRDFKIDTYLHDRYMLNKQVAQASGYESRRKAIKHKAIADRLTKIQKGRGSQDMRFDNTVHIKRTEAFMINKAAKTRDSKRMKQRQVKVENVKLRNNLLKIHNRPHKQEKQRNYINWAPLQRRLARQRIEKENKEIEAQLRNVKPDKYNNRESWAKHHQFHQKLRRHFLRKPNIKNSQVFLPEEEQKRVIIDDGANKTRRRLASLANSPLDSHDDAHLDTNKRKDAQRSTTRSASEADLSKYSINFLGRRHGKSKKIDEQNVTKSIDIFSAPTPSILSLDYSWDEDDLISPPMYSYHTKRRTNDAIGEDQSSGLQHSQSAIITSHRKQISSRARSQSTLLSHHGRWSEPTPGSQHLFSHTIVIFSSFLNERKHEF